jgi:hypothetical protein
VEEIEAHAAVCSASLISAPLEVVRRVTLDENVARVEEQVTNLGGDPIEVMWGHHPTFGAPFLEPGCTIETSARTFTADDRAPGAGLSPGRPSTWPNALLEDGGRIDLSVIPAPDERRAVLGYLSDFDEGSYRIVNPRVGLAAEIRWPLDVFPTAWFWQELRASPGYPWYRRAYTTALEPNTTAPAQGIVNARAKGGATLLLAPDVPRAVMIEAALVAV